MHFEIFDSDNNLDVLIRASLTILFGAIPATYLCVVPAFFVGLGAYELTDGYRFDEGFPSSFTLLVLYCLAALYGTSSLWLVPFTGPKQFVIVGLAAGMLVISPFTYSTIFQQWLYDRDDWAYSISTVLPFVVALCWLTAFGIAKYRSRDVGLSDSDGAA